MKPLLPMYAAMFVVLMMVTYIPAISEWLLRCLVWALGAVMTSYLIPNLANACRMMELVAASGSGLTFIPA